MTRPRAKAPRATHGGRRDGAGRPATGRAPSRLIRVSEPAAERLGEIAEERAQSVRAVVDAMVLPATGRPT